MLYIARGQSLTNFQNSKSTSSRFSGCVTSAHSVGEVFAAAMILEHEHLFMKNPHQDGYPDLLLLDSAGIKEWKRLAKQLREKAPFSPFKTGGFEVKATCGSVPSPVQCLKRGREKPGMGDQRIDLLTSYDWKAHHQETNHLFGLFWDFIDGCPTIAAVFYSSILSNKDWGTIIQPKEGGGRTTSVSIMTRDGVRKMYQGWVTFLAHKSYATFFDLRNNDYKNERRAPDKAIHISECSHLNNS